MVDPRTRNVPGFPSGVQGETLLGELREQAARFGIEPRHCKVRKLERVGDHFVARIGDERVEAAKVILAPS